MGAFEITSGGKLLFSKLASTFFPNTHAVTEKIISFVTDLRKGNDVSAYDISHDGHSPKDDYTKYYNSFMEPKSPQNKRSNSNKKIPFHANHAEHKKQG